MRDIQSGSHRIALVGTSESCMVPEVFEAFITMGALASDNSLRQLDGLIPMYCQIIAGHAGHSVRIPALPRRISSVCRALR